MCAYPLLLTIGLIAAAFMLGRAERSWAERGLRRPLSGQARPFWLLFPVRPHGTMRSAAL